jgi:hypothetical protein
MPLLDRVKKLRLAGMVKAEGVPKWWIRPILVVAEWNCRFDGMAGGGIPANTTGSTEQISWFRLMIRAI